MRDFFKVSVLLNQNSPENVRYENYLFVNGNEVTICVEKRVGKNMTRVEFCLGKKEKITCLAQTTCSSHEICYHIEFNIANSHDNSTYSVLSQIRSVHKKQLLVVLFRKCIYQE
jgi:hypothetical protein